ncbi:MAG: hypothetical protein ABJ117_08335, partial [Alphaproteobacteria bacterium]
GAAKWRGSAPQRRVFAFADLGFHGMRPGKPAFRTVSFALLAPVFRPQKLWPAILAWRDLST